LKKQFSCPSPQQTIINNSCSTTEAIIGKPHQSFWMEYKDYILGTSNIFITVLATIILHLVTRRGTIKDRKEQASYQSQLFLYQNTILPLHPKFVQLSSDMWFWKNDIEKFLKTSQPNRLTIIEKLITSLEKKIESFNSKEIKIITVYGNNAELIFKNMIEIFQDNLTTIIADSINIKTNNDLQKTYSKYTDLKNKFIEDIASQIQILHPQCP
jgi:hypothetical protein